MTMRHDKLPLPDSRVQRVTGDLQQHAEARHDGQAVRVLGVRRFRVKQTNHTNHDVVIAETWNGVTAGAIGLPIALEYDLRKSVVGEGYTYAGFQERTRDLDGREEFIERPFTIGDEILAVQVDGGTGVDHEGAAVIWQMISPSKHWAKRCE